MCCVLHSLHPWEVLRRLDTWMEEHHDSYRKCAKEKSAIANLHATMDTLSCGRRSPTLTEGTASERGTAHQPST